MKVAYLASGAASSARGIHEAGVTGVLDVESVAMVANNSHSGALEWARSCGVAAFHLSAATHPSPLELDEAIATALVDSHADLVVLSGYAKKVGPRTLAAFPQRILNVHPAPLPRFGGPGMFGLAVHEAVLQAGVAESAVTIHLVNEHYDDGATVAAWPVDVRVDDTPVSLQGRVHDAEPACWVDLLRRLQDRQQLPNLDWAPTI